MRFFYIYSLVLVCALSSCGRAYFPIQLDTPSRSERNQGQQTLSVLLIPMTEASIAKANLEPYKRRIVLGGDLQKPAKIIPISKSVKERLPNVAEPGVYTFGVGDQITFTTFETRRSINEVFTRELVVSDQGFLSIAGLGKFSVVGLNQAELQDDIEKRMIERGAEQPFELTITNFVSKKVYVSLEPGRRLLSLPYTNLPMFLSNVIIAFTQSSNISSEIGDGVVEIHRDGQVYTVSLSKAINRESTKIRIFPNDLIKIKTFIYKKERVMLVGETGGQKSISINPLIRETLSEIIFGSNSLNNISSDYSQIYVIRKSNKSLLAFHLDITNPVRIVLANKFEMRPEDIVFVATQPLSLYSRTLSQILGSSGATITIRNQLRNEKIIN